jgi:hypothetical protein
MPNKGTLRRPLSTTSSSTIQYLVIGLITTVRYVPIQVCGDHVPSWDASLL